MLAGMRKKHAKYTPLRFHGCVSRLPPEVAGHILLLIKDLER